MTHLDTLANRRNFVSDMIGQGLNHIQARLEHDNDPKRINEIRERLMTLLQRAFQFQVHHQEALTLIEKASPLMEMTGYWGGWQKLLAHGITIAEQMAEQQLLASLHHYNARILFKLSKPRAGESAYLKAIRLFRSLDDHYNEARACTNLGYNYIDFGHWWRSEILCLHALNLFNDLNNDYGLAHTENHLGVLYIRQKNWGLATDRLHLAMNLFAHIQDDRGLLHTYVNLGLLANEIEDHEGSIHWGEKALNQAEQLNDKPTKGKILNNISIAYLLKGDYQTSKDYIQSAHEIFTQFSDYLGTARANCNKARIELETGNFETCMALLFESLKTYAQFQNTDGIALVMELLIKCHSLLDHTQPARKDLETLDQIFKQHRWNPTKQQQLYDTIKQLQIQLS